MSAQLSEVNVRFSIWVRARPVEVPILKYFATHCFLVLLDPSLEVVDSLSFDPSNSVGWKDAMPTEKSEGEICVQRDCSFATWLDLSSAFKRRAKAKPYVLGNHNCCHAVMLALVSTNLRNSYRGISFAREANNTWHNVRGTLPSDDFIKKNV